MPRTACDTMAWITGKSLSIGRLDSVERWSRAFENRGEIEIMGASIRREMSVEETRIADNDQDHARVPTKHVWANVRERKTMLIKIPNKDE